jgi:hypothetical protein
MSQSWCSLIHTIIVIKDWTIFAPTVPASAPSSPSRKTTRCKTTICHTYEIQITILTRGNNSSCPTYDYILERKAMLCTTCLGTGSIIRFRKWKLAFLNTHSDLDDDSSSSSSQASILDESISATLFLDLYADAGIASVKKVSVSLIKGYHLYYG